MNFERPLAILFWMIVSFCAGAWCAYHPQQAFNWAGGAGDYIASIINRQCRPPAGYTCTPATTPTPTPTPTANTNPALYLK